MQYPEDVIFALLSKFYITFMCHTYFIYIYNMYIHTSINVDDHKYQQKTAGKKHLGRNRIPYR